MLPLAPARDPARPRTSTVPIQDGFAHAGAAISPSGRWLAYSSNEMIKGWVQGLPREIAVIGYWLDELTRLVPARKEAGDAGMTSTRALTLLTSWFGHIRMS